MPEHRVIPIAQDLCASGDLPERGRAQVFDVALWGRPARAFALRYEGRVVAYLNRCAHVPTELDWTEGEFLDADQRFILCSVHGASYEPKNGYCVSGPCRGESLRAVAVEEQGGRVRWWPDPDVQPAESLFEPAAPQLPQDLSAPT
jgi:nitrite reductase/ring-hydroxylating ferredoxin subunit